MIMKKLLILIIAVTFFMPAEAFCLRPTATQLTGEDFSFLGSYGELMERAEISIRSACGHGFVFAFNRTLAWAMGWLTNMIIQLKMFKEDETEILSIFQKELERFGNIVDEFRYNNSVWSGHIVDKDALSPDKLYHFYCEVISELEESLFLLESSFYILQKQDVKVLKGKAGIDKKEFRFDHQILRATREALYILYTQRDFLKGDVDIELFTVSSFFRRVYDIIDDYGPLTGGFKTQIFFTSPSSDVSIYANPILLARLIAECYNNTEKKRGRFDEFNMQVNASFVSDKEHVIITIEDDGPAIDKKLLPDEIFNLQRSPRKKRRIGMPEARYIAELMGGTIKAENINGHPRFTINLPGMPASKYPGISNKECKMNIHEDIEKEIRIKKDDTIKPPREWVIDSLAHSFGAFSFIPGLIRINFNKPPSGEKIESLLNLVDEGEDIRDKASLKGSFHLMDDTAFLSLLSIAEKMSNLLTESTEALLADIEKSISSDKDKDKIRAFLAYMRSNLRQYGYELKRNIQLAGLVLPQKTPPVESDKVSIMPSSIYNAVSASA